MAPVTFICSYYTFELGDIQRPALLYIALHPGQCKVYCLGLNPDSVFFCNIFLP